MTAIEIRAEKNWYKKCQMIEQYHSDEKKNHYDKRTFKWRVADTAKELGLSIGYVSEALKLATCKNVLIKELTRENALKVLHSMKLLC